VIRNRSLLSRGTKTGAMRLSAKSVQQILRWLDADLEVRNAIDRGALRI
jgi:hypothetical protein